MKRFKRFVRSPKTTWIAFGLAIVLLLFSSIGGASATLTYFSETYASRVQMSNIGVTLLEKSDKDQELKAVSNRDYSDSSNGTWQENTGKLLEGMLDQDEELVLGKKYQEELRVQNTGDIDQYVRVSIYKYWVKDGKYGADQEKIVNLDPGLIELNLVNTSDQGGAWIVDGEASTKERTVFVLF